MNLKSIRTEAYAGLAGGVVFGAMMGLGYTYARLGKERRQPLFPRSESCGCQA